MLQDLIDAPSTDRIRAAVQSLKDIGALDSQMVGYSIFYKLVYHELKIYKMYIVNT